MNYTVVSGNKPSIVSCPSSKSYNYSIYQNNWIKCKMLIRNLNMPTTKLNLTYHQTTNSWYLKQNKFKSSPRKQYALFGDTSLRIVFFILVGDLRQTKSVTISDIVLNNVIEIRHLVFQFKVKMDRGWEIIR